MLTPALHSRTFFPTPSFCMPIENWGQQFSRHNKIRIPHKCINPKSLFPPQASHRTAAAERVTQPPATLTGSAHAVALDAPTLHDKPPRPETNRVRILIFKPRILCFDFFCDRNNSCLFFCNITRRLDWEVRVLRVRVCACADGFTF